MGARYKVSRGSHALSTAADSMTIIAPAARSLKVWEIVINGLGTASAANVVLFQRSTGGTTPSGAITPAPLNPDFAAATFTVPTTFAAAPTLTANAILARVAVNANGGIARLVFPPGLELDIPAGAQLSVRSEVGTSNVSIDVTVEQV